MIFLNFLKSILSLEYYGILSITLIIVGFVVAPSLALILYKRIPKLINSIEYSIKKEADFLRVTGIERITLIDGGKLVRVRFSNQLNYMLVLDFSEVQAVSMHINSVFECMMFYCHGDCKQVNFNFSDIVGCDFLHNKCNEKDINIDSCKKVVVEELKASEIDKICKFGLITFFSFMLFACAFARFYFVLV